MICFKKQITKELSDIDDELKTIYHSKNTVCFFIFRNREKRNKFLNKKIGMNKAELEIVYLEYHT